MKTCIRTLIISILTFFWPFLAMAQFSPPLVSSGLQDIVYQKGTLDIELISSIIAGKQEELKKEAVKELILKDISGTGFLFYNFLSGILETTVTAQNKQLTTVQLAENTVNMALVYNFLAYYLEREFYFPSEKDTAFRELIRFCQARPQYLSANQQVMWQAKYNNTFHTENHSPLIFSLKSPSYNIIQSDYNSLNKYLNTTEQKYSLTSFSFIMQEIDMLQSVLQQYQRNSPSEYQYRNLKNPLIDKKNYFSRIFIEFTSKTSTYEKPYPEIQTLWNEACIKIEDTLAFYYNSSEAEYRKLDCYNEMIAKMNDLTEFIQQLNNNTGNSEFYNSIVNTVLFADNYTAEVTPETFMDFYYAFLEYQIQPDEQKRLLLEAKLQPIVKEIIKYKINEIKSGAISDLNDAINYKKAYQELKKTQYKEVFSILSDEGGYIFQNAENEISLDFLPIEIYYQIFQNQLTFEESVNLEISFKNISRYFEENEIYRFAESENKKSVLQRVFVKGLQNDSITLYKNISSEIEKYLSYTSFYQINYNTTNLLWANLYQSQFLANNSDYQDINEFLKYLDANSSNPQEIQKLFQNADTEVFKRNGLLKYFESAAKSISQYEPDSLQNAINVYEALELKMKELQNFSPYDSLNYDVQQKYQVLLNEIGEEIKDLNLMLDGVLKMPQMREFIHFCVLFSIENERDAVNKIIEEMEKQRPAVENFEEYADLMDFWKLADNYGFVSTKIKLLKNSDLFKNQIPKWKEFVQSEAYNEFLQNVQKNAIFIQNSDRWLELQKIKLAITNANESFLGIEERQIMLELVSFYEFIFQSQKLNEIRSLQRQMLARNVEVIPLNMILLDMIFDICKNNETIKKSGFFQQELNTDLETYNRSNAFLAMQYIDAPFYEKLLTVKKSMQKQLVTFFSFYQLIQELNYFQGQSIEQIRNNYISNVITTLADTTGSYGVRRPPIFYEMEKNISFIDSVFNKINLSLETVEKENTKITDIQHLIERYELSLKLNNDPKNYASKSIVNEINISIKFVSFDSIKTSIQNIKNELVVFNSNRFGNAAQNNELNLLLSELDTLLTFPYNFNASNDDAEFIEQYKQLNRKVIVEIGKLKNQVNLLNRNLLAQQLETQDYINYNLSILKNSFRNFEAINLSPEDQQILSNVYAYISILEKPQNDVLNFEFINYLRSLVIPQLVAINIKYRNGENKNQEQIAIHSLENILNYSYFILINRFTDTGNLFTPEVMQLSTSFINIISRLDQLDKVETYDVIFSTLADAGNIFPDSKATQTFNTVNNSLLQHLIINNNENTMSFDLESFLTFLYNRYDNMSANKTNFYFSVGVNQCFMPNKLVVTNSDNTISEIENIAFAAEKIGIKYSFIDFRKRAYERNNQSFGHYYRKQPIVNDLHTIVYGSGLLYNIVNTTTNSQFSYPVFGLGVGCSFYNNLDFNITASIPINNNPFETPMFGVSFDVKIGEYFSELNKMRLKRKENK